MEPQLEPAQVSISKWEKLYFYFCREISKTKKLKVTWQRVQSRLYWEFLIKCQTITFIASSMYKLSWLPTEYLAEDSWIYELAGGAHIQKQTTSSSSDEFPHGLLHQDESILQKLKWKNRTPLWKFENKLINPKSNIWDFSSAFWMINYLTICTEARSRLFCNAFSNKLC